MKQYLIVFALLFAAAVNGQDESRRSMLPDRNQFIVAWDIAIPTSGDYLDKTSFNGVRLDYRDFINRNFAWGISSGWNSYRQKVDRQLYESEDGSSAVFTDMIRKINELPITVNGYYYLDASAPFKPYAGLGLGTLYSQQKAFFNVYVIEENNWGFLIRPEIGIQYDINYQMGVHVYGAYSYATNSNDFFRIDSLSHVSVGVGLFWSY